MTRIHSKFILLLAILAVIACKKSMPETVIIDPEPCPCDSTVNDPQDPPCTGFSGFPEMPDNWVQATFSVPITYFNRGWEPYFLDENKGFMYGSDAVLMRTNDGGANWETASDFGNEVLYSLHFADNNNGFLSTLTPTGAMLDLIDGSLMQTSDGGNTWSKIDYTPKGILQKVFFLDANHGFALMNRFFQQSSMNESWFGETNDGGKTWNQVNGTDIANNIHNSIRILADGSGYFAGAAGKIWLTTDFGKTWKSEKTPITNVYRIQFLDKNTGFVSGYKKLMKTTDGGITWSTISDRGLEFFHFFSPEEGLTLQTVKTIDHGDYSDKCRAFLTTSDGGQTWKIGQASFNFNIGEVFFLNETMAFSSLDDFHPGTFVRLKR